MGRGCGESWCPGAYDESGPEAAGSALVRSAVLGPVVHGVLERAANAPERAGDDLVAAIAAEAKAPPTDVQAHLADQQPHPPDSHPTLGQRLAALGLEPAPALLDRATRPAGADEAALGPAFFADWPGLCRTLSGDLLARLREHDEAWQDELERAAAAMPEGDAALTENVRPAVVLATVGAPLLAIAAAVVFVAPELVYLDGERFFRAVIGGCLAIGASMLAGFGWTSHRRGRAPFLVLTPAELRSPHLRAPVPWADMADAGLAVDQNTFMLTLAMEHDAPLPQKTRHRARARVDRKARQVVLFSWRPRDLTPDDYAELVARYLHGARARALLSTRRAA